MSESYLFVEELDFISDRLAQCFKRRPRVAAQVSFKDVQRFQTQIRTWELGFIKPPKPLIAACNLELLEGFYLRELDFSIFHKFEPSDLKVIQEEISAHVAREALDAWVGYRLRNWSAVGLQSSAWARYQDLVHAYYEQTVSPEKQERILRFERALAQSVDLTPQDTHAQCVGELFFEVDAVRLMPQRRLDGHLAHVRQRLARDEFQEGVAPRTIGAPEALKDCYALFGFKDLVDFATLKAQYRQLALSCHPDKGGSLETMQKLNQAYRQIADHLQRTGV